MTQVVRQSNIMLQNSCIKLITGKGEYQDEWNIDLPIQIQTVIYNKALSLNDIIVIRHIDFVQVKGIVKQIYSTEMTGKVQFV